jgi:4-amino-4-deoxy-L-arabinose transferase-like glycosyltransferase
LNSPGKYLIELPMYLFPWTFAALAAARRALLSGAFMRRAGDRTGNLADPRAVRFAVSAFLPALLLLSLAATARNVYLAPALPGVALLIAWWGDGVIRAADRWDIWALRTTAGLLLVATAVSAVAASLVRIDAGESLAAPVIFVGVSSAGLILSALLALRAWNAATRDASMAQCALLGAYGALLLGPAAAIYGQVDRWQNLESIGVAVRRDAADHPVMLLAPDETTRALADMYISTSVLTVNGPLDEAALARASSAAHTSGALVLALLPGRAPPQNAWLARRLPTAKRAAPIWTGFPGLHAVKEYALPNGRRYALLKAAD